MKTVMKLNKKFAVVSDKVLGGNTGYVFYGNITQERSSNLY